jgi:hypothetical protein
MALNTISSTGNPCDILNTDDRFGMGLWNIENSPSPYILVASRGEPHSYTKMSTTDLKSINILKTIDPNSQVPLVRFLSTSSGPFDYTKIGNVIMNNDKIISIAATINSMKPGYMKKYSTPQNPTLQALEYWNPSDMDAQGNPVANPKSLIGRLLKQGILLTQAELFRPSDFDKSLKVTPGNESLIYLYNYENDRTKDITEIQTNKKIKLESKNLKFFGAFLSEYCFYRTRYDFLLKEYFTIYKRQGSAGNAYTPPALGDGVYSLFAGRGSAINQYTGTKVTQAEHLKIIAYHMALLNTKMTDMRTLLGHIASFYAMVSDNVKAQINNSSFMGSNDNLTKKLIALNQTSQTVNDYMTEKDFHEAAMQYNAEKNRYSNVLLGLYSFLNIAAVAMIIHIASS